MTLSSQLGRGGRRGVLSVVGSGSLRGRLWAGRRDDEHLWRNGQEEMEVYDGCGTCLTTLACPPGPDQLPPGLCEKVAVSLLILLGNPGIKHYVLRWNTRKEVEPFNFSLMQNSRSCYETGSHTGLVIAPCPGRYLHCFLHTIRGSSASALITLCVSTGPHFQNCTPGFPM